MKDSELTRQAMVFWLKKSGLTQSQLAEKAGVTQNYISQIATGAKVPALETIQKICEALEISVPTFFACHDDNLPEIAFVRKVRARPRAGTGGLETEGDVEEFYSFHSKFLARKGGNADNMVIFEVAGNSMEPTLCNGDMVMINTSENARFVRSGTIYLLRLEDELMIKRLENRPGGILLIRSDNQDYEDIPINKAEIDGQVEIFGRMVWSCREY